MFMNGWMLLDTQQINDACPHFKDILYVAKYYRNKILVRACLPSFG